MKILAEDIMMLRERTQLSLGKIKNALVQAGGDPQKALELLQVDGLVTFEKLAQRAVHEGRVHTYLHNNGRMAVLVEINCETDFAANTNEFKEFCERVALQIAGANPKYLSRGDVHEEDIERKIRHIIYDKTQRLESREEIINKTLEDWYPEICLLEQNCIEPPTYKTINECRAELAAKLGENIVIRRFARWEVGK